MKSRSCTPAVVLTVRPVVQEIGVAGAPAGVVPSWTEQPGPLTEVTSIAAISPVFTGFVMKRTVEATAAVVVMPTRTPLPE